MSLLNNKIVNSYPSVIIINNGNTLTDGTGSAIPQLAVTSSFALTASYTLSTSVTQSVVSSSFASSSLSASYAKTASVAVTALNAASSSYALSSSYILGFADITDLTISQSVGINQPTPQFNLDVSGTFNVLGQITNGDGTNVAPGQWSHAEGFGTQANGPYSHAEGYSSIASGQNSHAEGQGSLASGDYSHAEGGSVASGMVSHAEGNSSAMGGFSHAEGQSTSIGLVSHAEGHAATSSGSYSHAEGTASISIGIASHAEGAANQSIGFASHAEGFGNTTGVAYAHAEGRQTLSSGSFSHTEGYNTLAIGSGSHAEGFQSKANGDYSHTQGNNTVSSGSYQNVMGQFNAHGNTSSLVVIGNGAGDVGRSDLALFNSQSIVFNVPLTSSLNGNLVVNDGASISMSIGSSSLLRLSTNLVEQINGTTPQELNIYQKFIDPSNYRRLALYGTSGGDVFIDNQATGSPLAGGDLYIRTAGSHSIKLWTAGTQRWIIENNGALDPASSGIYDIGKFSRVGNINTTTLSATSDITCSGKLTMRGDLADMFIFNTQSALFIQTSGSPSVVGLGNGIVYSDLGFQAGGGSGYYDVTQTANRVAVWNVNNPFLSSSIVLISELNTLSGVNTGSSLQTQISAKQPTLITASTYPITSSVAVTASYSLNGGSLVTGSNYSITASWAQTASIVAPYSPYTIDTTSSLNWVTVSFNSGDQYVSIVTGNLYSFTCSNMPPTGQTANVSLFIDNSSSATSSFSFPANWIFLGSAPTSITASKSAVLSLKAFGGNKVIAAYGFQQ